MANFCPKCGEKVRNEQMRFCVACGSALTKPASENVKPSNANARAADETNDESSLVAPSHSLSQTRTSPQQDLRVSGQQIKSSGWKRFVIPLGVAGAFLAVIVGAAIVFINNSGDEAKQTASISTDDAHKQTLSAPNSSGTANRVETGTTQNASSSQAYTSSLDPLIEQNTQLELLIVTKANLINSVAPSGINDSLLSSITSLESNFRDLKANINSINPPNGFVKVQSDLIQLIDYNISRCDSLYRGTVAWKSYPDNESYFQSEFKAGQVAKEAYLKLYPTFVSEYQTAKGQTGT